MVFGQWNIGIKTVVAGCGLDRYKPDWEKEGVEVAGYVDDIAERYRRVAFVCVPLLSGGGMKVKTIEAMMFGKYIFGTDGAFSGFDVDYGLIGGLCNSAAEYIDAINAFLSSKHGSFFDSVSRKIYEGQYSEQSAMQAY